MPRKKAIAPEAAEAAEEPQKVTKKRSRSKKEESTAAAAPEITAEKPARKRTSKKTESTAVPAKKPRKAASKKAAPEAPQAPAPESAEAAVSPAEDTAPDSSPRRSVAFIGSECYPFVKTGGLGDVMYALPKVLARMNCDVRVILPRYRCIPWKYQQKMVYRGEFQMPLCSDGRSFYVGIMEYIWDGVVYDFIDNEEFFGNGKPYTTIVDDIPKYCFFSKAALAALNYMDWAPDIIHCHDWQAALIPVYLKTMFYTTPVGRAKSIFTIHNLRFQGIYNANTIRYWTGLPEEAFRMDALLQSPQDANMLKGGLTYADMITTVSSTYASEIQTEYYGEKLDAHLRYHAGKLRGIVNGIDCDIWDPNTDARLRSNYDLAGVLDGKKENKRALQEELGLYQDDHKFVIGLISRLTDQKGLDLVNAVMPQIMDPHTQVVVLGTGDPTYENAFRHYENAYRGDVSASILYDEDRAHRIYAGADALLVPSQFEPCGLTQLIAMRYGTVPIVRETGGLKDTVEPHNQFTHDGNGYTFDRYEANLLLDAVNRAKTTFFTDRYHWDEMVRRDMQKDVSWENSARQYKDLYLALTADRP